MFMPLIFFWVLYDQNGTEWQNQYEMMNHKFLGLINIPTEASSNLNSVLVIIVVPLLSYVVYPLLEKKGLSMNLITRMTIGYLFVIAAFVTSIILQFAVEANASSQVLEGNVAVSCSDCINGTWQLPQWILLSVGEALFAPTGVEFAYTQVGRQMKASAASLWLLGIAIGNYVVMGMEYSVGDLPGPTRQWIYTAISSFFLVVFIILSRFWFVSKEEEDERKHAFSLTESTVE
ncbi:hypothetical protein DSO57_1007842 [Entomophthora muscae]|uniref:Uncharacterized protein n=1 Tax=Entomophthora muscae TaxID=34485 RepID=A0ACC2RYD8_9FUNG|nr:hypothetical protein DSO57_1007842 [Entomophthora muscae]